MNIIIIIIMTWILFWQLGQKKSNLGNFPNIRSTNFDLWTTWILSLSFRFSHQAKLITGLESLRFPSLSRFDFTFFYIKNVMSSSVRRQREKRVSDEIRRWREWIQRADGLSSVTVRTRHGLCMCDCHDW